MLASGRQDKGGGVMTCKPLDELLRSSTGPGDELSAEVMAHVESCQTCVAELRREDEMLKAHWLEQPDSIEHLQDEEIARLATYGGGSVPVAERPLWRHIVHCEECRDTLANVRGALVEYRSSGAVVAN